MKKKLKKLLNKLKKLLIILMKPLKTLKKKPKNYWKKLKKLKLSPLKLKLLWKKLKKMLKKVTLVTLMINLKKLKMKSNKKKLTWNPALKFLKDKLKIFNLPSKLLKTKMLMVLYFNSLIFKILLMIKKMSPFLMMPGKKLKKLKKPLLKEKLKMLKH